MFKPPKLFRTTPTVEGSDLPAAPAVGTVPPAPMSSPMPTPAPAQAWNTMATPAFIPKQPEPVGATEAQSKAEPEMPTPQAWSPATPPPSFDAESVAEPTLATPVVETVVEAVVQEAVTAPAAETAAPDMSRYARPHTETVEEEVKTETVEPAEPVQEETIQKAEQQEEVLPKTQLVIDTKSKPQKEEATQHVIRAVSVASVPFADLWFTPENIAYIRDERTKFALVPFETDDLKDFHQALEQGYTGSSSYALKFAGEQYRVERIITTTGVQYNCRKMPTKTPDIYTLGLPEPIVNYLVGLSQEAGLILFGGPTGMGKTTTASALMRKYLEKDGGFMYTIEDPPEMPLDGLYHAANGALGLCKQCPVENERWSDGIKSALRSRPRYILVGEIRTPETASQVLRAATSGHLVLSTIHASSVEDAINSILKYAAGSGLAESLVNDLLARSVLAVVHQKLEGTEQLRPVLHTAFANPNPLSADQMRMNIRDGKINLGTLMEAQTSKLFQGKPLFRD